MYDKFIDFSGTTDIIPITVGREKCASGYKFGPHVRSYYVIHFCLSGKGTLIDKFGKREISAGELFIIRPDEVSTYMADLNDPWEYAWITFNGKGAVVFNTDCSVYPYKKRMADKLQELYENNELSPFIYISFIYELIHCLFNEKKMDKVAVDAIDGVLRYLEFNYMKEISVERLSQEFGFERSYLYRIFKRKTGKSIKEYLITIRMDTAKRLLERGYSVKSTAFSVGYKDEFTFSRAFKSFFGHSPSTVKNR